MVKQSVCFCQRTIIHIVFSDSGGGVCLLNTNRLQVNSNVLSFWICFRKILVRNLERQPENSFWLQTSTDKFYPDFVGLINDGRVLVVEYKGTPYYSNDDSKEKRLLGDLWEAKSGGKCLFVMPTGRNYEKIRTKVLQ